MLHCDVTVFLYGVPLLHCGVQFSTVVSQCSTVVSHAELLCRSAPFWSYCVHWESQFCTVVSVLHCGDTRHQCCVALFQFGDTCYTVLSQCFNVETQFSIVVSQCLTVVSHAQLWCHSSALWCQSAPLWCHILHCGVTVLHCGVTVVHCGVTYSSDVSQCSTVVSQCSLWSQRDAL